MRQMMNLMILRPIKLELLRVTYENSDSVYNLIYCLMKFFILCYNGECIIYLLIRY